MKNKVVFITGGSRGLGAYTAKQVLAAGGSAYCVSRSGNPPEISDGIDGNKLGSGVIDLSDYTSCEKSLRDCVSKFGRIDVLINNVSGYFGGKEIGQYSADALRSEIESTLLGGIFVTNAFMALANKRDTRQHIIFVSSISGLGREQDNGLHCVYAAAKAGVIRFSETINETTRKLGTSSHVIIPNNIRNEQFVEQNAISFEDVYKAIDFLIKANDNLYVDQILLNPFLVSRES